MSTFLLKHGDTLPIMVVALLDADGTPFDPTGSTDWKLRIYISAAVQLVRTMTLTDGELEYAWLPTDWDAPSGGNPAPVGGLVEGAHRMEYEVSFGTNRITFPNGGYDTLRVIGEIG